MRRSREATVKRLLQEVRIPDELGAQQRAWPVARSAFAGRLSVPRRRSRLRFAPVPAVLLLVAGVLGLTPAGAAVHRWIEKTLSPTRTVSMNAMSLPAPGSLLVSGAAGAWIVSGRGERNRLGPWTSASWSPHALYAVVTSAEELAAVDRRGKVDWRVRVASPRDASWSPPSGYRISYLSGSALWVITGNAGPRDGFGPNKWQVAGDAAPVAPVWRPDPAWRPGRPLRDELVYVSSNGSVVAVNGDSGQRRWHTRVPGSPVLLSFGGDGSRLLALTQHAASVLDGGGRRVATIDQAGRDPFIAGALSPNGKTLALLSYRTVTFVDLGSTPRTQAVFTARGGGLRQVVWSPDGRWLLATWPTADQWVLIRATGQPSDEIISHVSEQFRGAGRRFFPRIDGWCCTTIGGTT
ncbi:MAG: hypothetical protein M3076_15675 [Actinomycetota bacterium]|nr:hypothetical protein [Actinomycetota bacterium]